MNLSYHFAQLFVLLCGLLSYTSAQFRIINGEDTPIEQSKHSVAIFRVSSYLCVGSLVNVNTVVTAAHCLKGKEQADLVLIAGFTHLSERGRGQIHNVQYIHYDPDFDANTRLMDVAVVKVEGSFEEKNGVKSISLSDEPLVPGMTMQISGWGVISQTSKVFSNQLKTKYVDIVNTQECKTLYARVCLVNLAETIICAGRGGCYGDSGAAGVRNGQLCAVLEGGSPDPNFPDKYTDVTNARVRDFITSKM